MGSFIWLFQFLSIMLFLLHFQAISSSLVSSTQFLCHHDESLALIRFKNSFSIASGYEDAYPKTESWKEGTDCCLRWDGVICDMETGYVIGLNLSNSMLFGTFPSNSSLFFLYHLQTLDLSDNYFNRSHISSQIGQFSNLTYLNLSSSGFVGHVPPQISFLSNLVSLDLSFNYGLSLQTTTVSKLVHNLTKLTELKLSETNLSSVAPYSFMNLPSSLSYLGLSSCGLSQNFLKYIGLPINLASLDLSWNYGLSLETTSFSKLVGNLTMLRELDLSSVNMSLVAPHSLLNLSSSLLSLNLWNCGLRGEFPGAILQLPNLQYLDIGSNTNITSISPSMPNRSSFLHYLDISDTQFPIYPLMDFFTNFDSLEVLDIRSCNFVGSNLALLGNLTQLNQLMITDNNFNGAEIPSSFGNLVKLFSLDLSYCNFSGQIPFSLSNLTQISVILLSDNNLNGQIPSFLGNFSHLFSLDLSDNNLNGHIPSTLGNLSPLSTLSFSNNNLNGQIPSIFGNLFNLSTLDLSDNHLTGQIPSSLGNLSQLSTLDLSNNNLIGQIPSSLGNLSQLSTLDLSNNNLNGQIPTTFANLTELKTLSLSNNQLIGTIPFQLGGLSHLHHIDLSNNFLTGRLNDQIAPFSLYYAGRLAYIDLSQNKLHDTIPSSFSRFFRLNVLILSSNDKLTGEIPFSICNLNSLQILDLSNNSLSGSLTKCLGIESNIVVLHLGMNYFNGTIPSSFSKGNPLRYINFNGNQLQGKIPSAIINCEKLEFLDLGNNKLLDTFPYFLGALQELQVLVLRSNKLYGMLKNFNRKSSFPKLRILDLCNNSLSGPIPKEYFDQFEGMMSSQLMGYMNNAESGSAYKALNPRPVVLVTPYSYDYSVQLTLKGFVVELPKIQTLLTTIDFSCNKFIGKIPQSIGMLKSLKQLNMSHNQFTGHIQPSLGNLINLESLDLSSNLLTGRIPFELEKLTFLEVFRVSCNQLEGPIPQSKQFSTFDSSSYEGNQGLCGFPLQKECNNGGSEQRTPLKEDASKSDENGFGWKAVLVGYTSGVLFGLAIGFVVFRTRKHSWFVRMIEAEGYHWRKRFDKFKNTSKFTRRAIGGLR